MDSARIRAYLRHIGVEHLALPVPLTVPALRDLHLAHQRNVPFENLSIHLGEDIVLSEDGLVAKIVERRRGGFCYELNGAFSALLTALGFEVTLLQARVYGDSGRLGIPFDHLALGVSLPDGSRWLADVGFGTHSHFPLDLGRLGAEQQDPGGAFVITETTEGDLQVVKDGEREYLLEQRPRALEDFRAGAWYHRTSPTSGFTRSLVCSRLTEEGRITLSGRTLKRTVADVATTTDLTSDAEVLDAYRRHFGIDLDRVPRVAEPVQNLTAG